MKKKGIIQIFIIIILIIILAGLVFYYFKDDSENNQVNELTQNQKSNNTEYTDITAKLEVSDTQTLSDESYSTETEDESVIMTTDGGNLTLKNIQISKTGDTTNTESSEFYGLNSALLAKTQSGISIRNSNITTDAEGANAIFATGENAVINVNNVIIKTSQNSSRGLDATYGGKIIADTVSIFTKGAHCASLATDRGEGTVTVTNGDLNTEGEGSPLIYSTGTITVNNSVGTATGSSIAVIEGKNIITANTSDLTGYGYGRATGGIDNCGIMIYQSMSGDASEGIGTFTASDSKLTISSKSTIYSSVPMFFVTNTNAVINLTNCNISYGSGILLNATGNDGEWGTKGSNGGTVTLNSSRQKLEGSISADNISEININITDESTLTSKINQENTAKSISLSIDSTSTWNVTGNSYITVLNDTDETLSNIKSNGYTIYYNSENNSWLNGKTITLSGGGVLKPM